MHKDGFPEDRLFPPLKFVSANSFHPVRENPRRFVNQFSPFPSIIISYFCDDNDELRRIHCL